MLMSVSQMGTEVAAGAHAVPCAGMQSYALMHSGMPLLSASLWFKASYDSVATVNPQLTLFSKFY